MEKKTREEFHKMIVGKFRNEQTIRIPQEGSIFPRMKPTMSIAELDEENRKALDKIKARRLKYDIFVRFIQRWLFTNIG